LTDPICASLGMRGNYQPHHDSLFIESRILPIKYLHSYYSLIYMHRLFTLNTNSLNDPHFRNSNLASLIFNQQYVNTTNAIINNNIYTNYPYNHNKHIYTYMSSHMSIVPPLGSKSLLLSIDRKQIRSQVFNYFYNKWYLSIPKHSLHPYYPSPIPPSIKSLPLYFMYHNSIISTFISRLRFDRACLNVSLFKRHRSVTNCCPFCPNVPETVHHIIMICPKYMSLRSRLAFHFLTYNISITFLNIMNAPPLSLSAKKRAEVCSFVSEYICGIRRIRLF